RNPWHADPGTRNDGTAAAAARARGDCGIAITDTAGRRPCGGLGSEGKGAWQGIEDSSPGRRGVLPVLRCARRSAGCASFGVYLFHAPGTAVSLCAGGRQLDSRRDATATASATAGGSPGITSATLVRHGTGAHHGRIDGRTLRLHPARPAQTGSNRCGRRRTRRLALADCTQDRAPVLA